MKNKKGFTLIELLAVIVILAILLGIAIPKVTQYITNFRKDSLIGTAREYVTSVRHDITDEIYDAPIGTDEVVIVSLDLIQLEKGKKKSPFNGTWLPYYSYVAVINTGTDETPDYKYFVAIKDSKRYTITLMSDEDITRNSIVRNNIQGTKAEITSVCGSPDGEYMVIDKIIGLEQYQPIHGWNATIYSSQSC